jgi:putative cell wall-binding protein
MFYNNFLQKHLSYSFSNCIKLEKYGKKVQVSVESEYALYHSCTIVNKLLITPQTAEAPTATRATEKVFEKLEIKKKLF